MFATQLAQVRVIELDQVADYGGRRGGVGGGGGPVGRVVGP